MIKLEVYLSELRGYLVYRKMTNFLVDTQHTYQILDLQWGTRNFGHKNPEKNLKITRTDPISTISVKSSKITMLGVILV